MEQELGKLVYLDAAQILVIPGRNTRFEMGDIEELAQSIMDNGIRKPVEVQVVNKQYELIDGHRRMAGIELAQSLLKGKGTATKVKIPAIVKKAMSEEDLAAEMLISNDGKPFLPLEEAMMLKRLFDKGESIKDISKRVGRSVSHVSDRLALVGAAPEVQEAIKEGELSTSDAITIVRKIDSKAKQAEFVGKVKTHGAKIVHQELKKGRLQKHQWDAAEEAFGDFQASLGGDIQFEGQELCMADLQEISNIEKLLSLPVFDLMYQFGRLKGMAELASLTPAELANRLHEKATGRPGKFKD